MFQAVRAVSAATSNAVLVRRDVVGRQVIVDNTSTHNPAAGITRAMLGFSISGPKNGGIYVGSAERQCFHHISPTAANLQQIHRQRCWFDQRGRSSCANHGRARNYHRFQTTPRTMRAVQGHAACDSSGKAPLQKTAFDAIVIGQTVRSGQAQSATRTCRIDCGCPVTAPRERSLGSSVTVLPRIRRFGFPGTLLGCRPKLKKIAECKCPAHIPTEVSERAGK